MDDLKSQLVLFRPDLFRFNRNIAALRPNLLDALKNQPLLVVANDIMQLLATHLTPASAASFSLSCRQIGLVIGTQYIDGLKISNDDTSDFLNLLEDDLQDQISCNFCRKLHRIRSAMRYAKNSYCWNGYSTNPNISDLLAFDTIPTCLKEDELLEIDLYTHEN